MQSNFETLGDSSRIWIYQADRKLMPNEQQEMLTASLDFMQEWAAHGQDLKASATIKFDQFLIIATDENFNMASGCSIDSSVHFVQDLGNKFKIDFFDRMKLAFLNNGIVSIVPLNELKTAINNLKITLSSKFFNNTILSKGELKEKWLINASESWLKRYFKVHESV